MEREPRHSAFEEFSRDERRPAVLLLAALVIAALFFALGIMVGRWISTGQNAQRPQPENQTRPVQPPLGSSSPVSIPSPSTAPAPSPSSPTPSVRPSARPTPQPSRR